MTLRRIFGSLLGPKDVNNGKEEAQNKRDDAEQLHSSPRPSHFEPPPIPSRQDSQVRIRLPPDSKTRDLYPDPLANHRPANNSSTSQRRNEASAREEENRLLGTYKTPKDATIIAIPGREMAPKNKPGSNSNFRPMNTLNNQRFSTGAQPARVTGASPRQYTGTARRQAPTTVLDLHAARGSNVPRERDFPDERKYASKRQKKVHPSTPSSRMEAQYVEISDDESQGHNGLRRVVPQPPRASQASHRIAYAVEVQPRKPSNNEVFQLNEFHEVEERAQRNGKSTGTKSEHFSRATQSSLARSRNQSRGVTSREVINLEEPEEPQESNSVSLTGIEAYANEVRNDDEVEITGENIQSDTSTLLQPYFHRKSARDRSEANGVNEHEGASQQAVPLSDPSISYSNDDRKHAGKNGVKRPRAEEPVNIDNSYDELAPENDVPNPKRQKSPSKSTTQQPVRSNARHNGDEIDDSEYEDRSEIKHTYRRPQNGRAILDKEAKKRVTQHPDLIGAAKRTFPVEEVCNTRGERLSDVEPMLLYYDNSVHPGVFRLKRESDDEKLHPDYKIVPKSVNKYTWCPADNCPIARLEEPGGWLHDIVFGSHDAVRDFRKVFQNLATVQDYTRHNSYMTSAYGKRARMPPAVDNGEEERLLQARITKGQPSERPSHTARGAQERPHQHGTLRSQMKVEPEKISAVRKSRHSPEPIRYEPIGSYDMPIESPPSSGIRRQPVRTTRSTTKFRSPTPELLERYSEKFGLGDPWDQPIVYPETGKKKATVEFQDLQKLDEGEFINDSLIEFYFRWLQEEFPTKERTVYFLNTHFYTKLTDVPRGQRGTINYPAVQRWVKDDIFSHDFVVVPINESMHWYVAIICNLPNVERKFLSEEEDVRFQGEGTSSQPVDVEGIEEIEHAAEIRRDSVKADEALQKSILDWKLNSSSPAPPTTDNGLQLVIEVDEESQAIEKKDIEVPAADNGTEITTAAEDEVQLVESQIIATQLTDSGIFSHANQASPEKKKTKRKSGPPPKKYKPDGPIIVVLDSLGGTHSRLISNLKEYLVEEAREKRQMDLDKSVFQGFHARAGIPYQENFSDCGLFVCGYIHKFMMDPHAFGKKLLAQEFEQTSDWPEMDPKKMRNDLRSQLQSIAAQQKEMRRLKKAEKRKKKLEAGIAASVGASSPLKAPRAQVDGASSPAKTSPAKADAVEGKKLLGMPLSPDIMASSVTVPAASQPQRSSPARSQQTRSGSDEMLMKPTSPAQPTPKRYGPEPFFEDLKVFASQQEPEEIPDSQPEKVEIADSQPALGPEANPGAPLKIYEDPPSQSKDDDAIAKAEAEAEVRERIKLEENSFTSGERRAVSPRSRSRAKTT